MRRSEMLTSFSGLENRNGVIAVDPGVICLDSAPPLPEPRTTRSLWIPSALSFVGMMSSEPCMGSTTWQSAWIYVGGHSCAEILTPFATACSRPA